MDSWVKHVLRTGNRPFALYRWLSVGSWEGSRLKKCLFILYEEFRHKLNRHFLVRALDGLVVQVQRRLMRQKLVKADACRRWSCPPILAPNSVLVSRSTRSPSWLGLTRRHRGKHPRPRIYLYNRPNSVRPTVNEAGMANGLPLIHMVENLYEWSIFNKPPCWKSGNFAHRSAQMW